ncbi:molybdenum cofactor cytidylyltransferase [Clostridium sp.]|uniref:molybdenum cofactor cytidylyltransferase n=1 Tax=Clostridium sp. TaxID=1506 RepID=UPI003F3EFDC6
MITAIVMASGLSKRMGTNKLLLEYKGKIIIDYTLKTLKDINFMEVIVVSQYDEVLDLAREYKFKAVKNNNAILGQSESIKLGIQNSKTCDGYMFFVGDQPFINKKDIESIIDTFKKHKDYIVIPRFNLKNGNPVIFPYNKKEDLMLLRNDEKGKKIIKSSTKIKYVDVEEDMLFDIDTKEDYDKMMRYVK